VWEWDRCRTDLNGEVWTRGYDAAGRGSKLTYPDGTEVERGYTDRGQLATLAVDSTAIDTRPRYPQPADVQQLQ